MKRTTLASLDADDQISMILAHPLAGRYVSNLIEDVSGDALLASYSAVFDGGTVCLRVPSLLNGQGNDSYLLIWHGESRTPWRVDSKVLPRDSAELRLLVCALTTGRRASKKAKLAA